MNKTIILYRCQVGPVSAGQKIMPYSADFFILILSFLQGCRSRLFGPALLLLLVLYCKYFICTGP